MSGTTQGVGFGGSLQFSFFEKGFQSHSVGVGNEVSVTHAKLIRSAASPGLGLPNPIWRWVSFIQFCRVSGSSHAPAIRLQVILASFFFTPSRNGRLQEWSDRNLYPARIQVGFVKRVKDSDLMPFHQIRYLVRRRFCELTDLG